MKTKIIKRDGSVEKFNKEKITNALRKAFGEKESAVLSSTLELLTNDVLNKIENDVKGTKISVEQVQDIVEQVLMVKGYTDVAKRYILYRAARTAERERKTKLIKTFDEITFSDSNDSDLKRDNANINGDTAMGSMLKYGSEGAKSYYERFIIPEKHSKAHRNGDIHIHDMDFYALTTTCCQIDIVELFRNGFSTGHGFLREPNDIQSYSALACIAIQSNQNDQHGGQSIPNFDYGLAIGVLKTYRTKYSQNIAKALKWLYPNSTIKTEEEIIQELKRIWKDYDEYPTLSGNPDYERLEEALFTGIISKDEYLNIKSIAIETSKKETDRATYQAMEALVHNLNTMHSRAGAQVPFSSINYGTDTSPEGRMVIKNILLATEAGLGNGETPIFPIHIFKVKEGINYNPNDPNYDLFKLAIKVSAKRLFPNFVFLDAPFNLKYYKPGKPETEVCSMGCRTRVIGNVYDPSREISYSRGNLSFTSINLPRLAIESNGDINMFFNKLKDMMDLVVEQLLDRFEIQAKKKVKNYPFLMGQGVWIDSKKLKPNDEVRDIIKHGTLSIGFIGLAETLIALIGKHHGESQEAQELGLKIVSFMRKYLDDLSNKTKMNFSLLATPAEGLSGRFVKIDKEKYGIIKGVTDKDYYTNSFHVPVYYSISAIDKIKIEAPYHELTNAGHITYVELDGDTANNLEAFEAIIRAMKEYGIGYGSINHPVDRDPICGYTGIINDECPNCGRKETENEPFERIRRITGYLVGTLDRFNNAKKAEEKDRVKHSI